MQLYQEKCFEHFFINMADMHNLRIEITVK